MLEGLHSSSAGSFTGGKLLIAESGLSQSIDSQFWEAGT